MHVVYQPGNMIRKLYPAQNQADEQIIFKYTDEVQDTSGPFLAAVKYRLWAKQMSRYTVD